MIKDFKPEPLPPTEEKKEYEKAAERNEFFDKVVEVVGGFAGISVDEPQNDEDNFNVNIEISYTPPTEDDDEEEDASSSGDGNNPDEDSDE